MSNPFDAYRRKRAESWDVDALARAWLVKLDDEPASKESLAEFRAWLARSPLHRRAFEHAGAAWRNMDGLTKILDRDSVAGSGAARGQSTSADSRPTRGWLSSRVRVATMMAAAAVMVIGLLSSILYLSHSGGGQAASATYATATGEVRMITLSDGSTVRLNTGSRVIVAYGKKARILQLAAGEAYFEVAPNPQRPFVVYAGRFAVRALGTAFAVHMLDSGVDLTVTKGHVELASFATAPGNIGGAGAAGKGSLGDGEAVEARVPVYSGQHATVVNRVRLVEQIDARGIERKLSWREGRLIFDDDPLTDVVSEISRYTSARIVISDPSIRNLKIGGYFKVQDIGSILDTLQESFGIEVRKDKDNAIYLSRGPAAQ